MSKTYKALVDFNVEDASYVAGESYELSDEVVATLPEGTVEEVAAPAEEAVAEEAVSADAEPAADAPASEEATA